MLPLPQNSIPLRMNERGISIFLVAICGRKTLTRGPGQAAETVLPFFCSLPKSLENFEGCVG